MTMTTRATASDVEDGDSDDGSLGDLSMENYTIDLAVLARRASGRIGRMDQTGKEAGRQRESEAEEENLADFEDSKPDGRPLDEVGHETDGSDYGGDFLDDYEIDLRRLDDKPSSVVVEDGQEELDEVASEADGPNDFTLNMGAWMRGDRKVVKTGDVPSDLDEQKRGGPSPQLEDGTLGFSVGDQSILEPVGMSTPYTKAERVEHGNARQEVQVDKRPLMARGETELQQDLAAEEVFERISALQAEVEELRETEEKRRSAFNRLSTENELLREAQAKLKTIEDKNAILLKQNADLHAKIQERKPDFATTASPLGSSSHSESHVLDMVTKEIGAARPDLESNDANQTLEAGLKASHSMVRRLREEMAEDEELHNVKIAGLREDLERLRAEVDVNRGQIADLEQDIETHTEIVKHRDDLIGRLTADAQVVRTDFGHAQQEARESRRIAQSIEEENDRLSSQQSRQTEELAAMEIALQSKVRELQTANATIATLQDTLKDADVVEDCKSEVPQDLPHQATLDTLKQEHSSALAALNQKFARQLQLFKRDRDKQAAKHATELATAKKTPSPNTALEIELRSAIRVLSSKLEKANNTTRETRTSLEKTQADLEHAHRIAQANQRENEVTNAEMDARFVASMNAREKEWRKRMALLFRERERMAKALMVGWGRKDVGEGVTPKEDGGQGYRYRFMKR